MNLPLQYLMSNCIFVINSPNDLFRMKKYSLLFGFSLFILINNLAAQVAGDLDTTFDFDGTLIFNFTEGGNGASSMVLQPDGKIVIGGGAITDVFTDFVPVPPVLLELWKALFLHRSVPASTNLQFSVPYSG